MAKLRISARDTFHEAHNLDDYHSDGSRYDGPRPLRISWLPFYIHKKIDVYFLSLRPGYYPE